MVDSKMQYKIMAKRPADLLKAFSVASGWSKLGTEANERILSCFQQTYEQGHKFFVTLGPMTSFKYKFEEWTPEGIICIRQKNQEVLLAKPVRGH